ncbi:hypothetical protein HYY74_07215 [Candidatus Woesearchaeota archaeon]|nr:hypothetical protein [Candidatus Woesearchaeota archaeon]
MDTDIQATILKYIQKNKAANTYKLARNLGVDRERLVEELAKLQEKGLIEHRTGMVRHSGKAKAEAAVITEAETFQKVSKPKTERPRIKKQIVRHVPKMRARRILKNSFRAGKPAGEQGWLSNLTQNIGQLSIPEVFGRKIEFKGTGFDFSRLNGRISQLEIPVMLKKRW